MQAGKYMNLLHMMIDYTGRGIVSKEAVTQTN